MNRNIDLIFKSFTLGIKVSALISLLIFSGIRFDKHFETAPLFTISFSLCAIILSYMLAGKFFMEKLADKFEDPNKKDF